MAIATAVRYCSECDQKITEDEANHGWITECSDCRRAYHDDCIDNCSECDLPVCETCVYSDGECEQCHLAQQERKAEPARCSCGAELRSIVEDAEGVCSLCVLMGRAAA